MTFVSGQRLTAAALNDLLVDTVIRKAAVETVTSSTTVQNDDDFSVTLDPGTYLITVYAHTSGVEAGDIKTRWAVTGTMYISRRCIGAAVAMTDRESTTMIHKTTSYDTEQSYGVDSTGTTLLIEKLHVEVSVAGDLTFQWAQATSNTTGTALSTASTMEIRRVA